MKNDDLHLYENWVNCCKYTGYTEIKLSNTKAVKFQEDVYIMVYYATHQTTFDLCGVVDMSKENVLIGSGTEQKVYKLNNKYVYKVPSGRGFRPGLFACKDVNFIFNTLCNDAKRRNRHIFTKNVFPIIAKDQEGGSKVVVVQEKMKPVDLTNNVEVEKAKEHIHRLKTSSFWNEVYSKLGDGPRDLRLDNWAWDENGVLWGIDLK